MGIAGVLASGEAPAVIRGMLGARGIIQGGGRSLPYNAEVEWLQNVEQYQTGGPSILLPIGNIPFDEGYIVSVGFAFAMTTNEDRKGFGNLTFGMSARLGQFRPSFGGSFMQSDVAIDTVFHEFKVERFRQNATNDNRYWFDGNYLGLLYSNSVWDMSDFPLFLFSPTPTTRYPLRIYYFRVEQYGEAVQDYIPIRFTNENGVSEGAMYDRVSGGLFRNQGTGYFIVGPDKR